MESGTGIGQNSGVGRNRSEIIPPINTGSLGIFDRRTSDLSNRSAFWNFARKIESKNLGSNNIYENNERENNFEVEKFGRKIL